MDPAPASATPETAATAAVPAPLADVPAPAVTRRTRPGFRVSGAAALLVGMGALCWLALPDRTGVAAGTAPLPWPVLLGMFAVAEVVVLHVQVRREARTVSMSEIPLVLGLFFAAPAVLLASRVVGAALVYVLHRRQSPLKVAFNSALGFADLALALLLFRLLAPSDELVSAPAWVAAYLAACASSAFAALAVAGVIFLYEGVLHGADLRRGLLAGIPVAVLTTTLGLIAANCLLLDRRTGWLLGGAAVLCVLAYRAYAELAERHLALERLYRFSQVVGSTPEIDGVMRSVLAQARDLLHAEVAELVFVPSGGDTVPLRVTFDGSELVRRDDPDLRPGEWLWSRVVRDGQPVLLSRSGKDPESRRHLALRGVREAVVAPLHGGSGVIGFVGVADRMGSVRNFMADDVQLLETVANHASMALRNSRLVDRLRHEALHDELTGLPNRTHLQRESVEALEQVARGALPSCALLVMDLDGFKEVNDTLGHLHGDLLLREVATRLLTTCPASAVVARLGGDEFAILLPAFDEAAAVQLGRRLREALEEPAELDGLQLEVGGSIGVAVAPVDGMQSSELLKRADVAMYAAKTSGRGVVRYDPVFDDGEPSKLVLATELRQALARDEMEVHAQPQADARTRDVVGVELLLRWRHPTRGLVLPDAFIPVAERTGLLRALTTTVLGEGIAAAARWRDAGLDLSVAVNLSARSLLDPDLVVDVLALLQLHRLPADRLTLEITESSIMTDLDASLAVLDRLHAAGVRLSVDDFGTGYSSLSYLSRLPVQEVKIDKHFVLGMATDAQDATIVRSVLDLGANLGLSVVAEGVEDEPTWQRLCDLGCDVVQGYHLARPMPLGDVPGWLEQRDTARPPEQRDPRLTPLQPGSAA